MRQAPVYKSNIWYALWALAGPKRNRFLRGLLWRFLQSVSLGFAFSLMIYAINELASGRVPQSDSIWLITVLMCVSLAGQIGFSYLANRDIWLTAFELTLNLRLHLLQRLKRLPMQFHLARQRGDTLTALTDDVSLLEAVITEGLPRMVQAIGLPLIVMGWLGWQNPALALGLCLPIFAAIPFLVWASRRMAELGRKRQDLQADAASAMIEFVLGQQIIRACNHQANGQARFRSAIDDFRSISIQMVGQLTLPLVGFAAILLLGIPMTIGLLGWQITNATQPVSIVVVLLLMFSVYLPLLALSGVLELTRMADASMGRIGRILNASLVLEPETGEKPKGHRLRFEDVRFAYPGSEEVLKGINFTAEEGQLTAIVGASGSGKSTILNLLMRYWDVTAGAVRIGGCDLRRITSENFSELVSSVAQDVYLFDGSIAENIALARPDAKQTEIEASADAAKIHDFILTLPNGYDTLVGEGGARLSGGERQRIAIARAILKDAPVLLLDEFTSAIDPTGERAILQALASAMEGRTVVSVTHRQATARAADQVIFLRDGRIQHIGRHADLMKVADYRAFWQSQ